MRPAPYKRASLYRFGRHKMNSSFVKDRSRTGLYLGDYQSNIHQFRRTAAELWTSNCSVHSDQPGFNSEVLPPFFIDKYSFRSWLACETSMVQSEFINIPEADFTNLFESYDEIVRKSGVGSKLLNTKAPSVDEPVCRSKFLDDHFGAWRKHLASKGVDLSSETIDWYFSVPLLEVYRNSVFYPRFPVLWGPNYFGKIADRDRDYILATYGQDAVWDFYFLMMVCHEQSHLMQKGEPILNEITHAILWIDFVFEQGLKPFQVNSETGKTGNIEAPFIMGRIDDLKGLDYKLLFEDNLTYFEKEVSSSEYSHFVALTFLVHSGVLRYRYVTNLFCGLLAEDVEVSRYLQSGVARHVSVVLQAFVQGESKLVLRDLVKSQMPSFGAIQP